MAAEWPDVVERDDGMDDRHELGLSQEQFAEVDLHRSGRARATEPQPA